MAIIHGGSRPITSMAEDVNEDRATSSIPELPTAGAMRAALEDVQAWANGVALPAGGVCFQQGAQSALKAWVDYTMHLMRKLDDISVVDEVPSKAIAAMDEVASFAALVGYTHGLDDASVPYVKERIAAQA